MSDPDVPTENALDDDSSTPPLWGWHTFASIGITLAILVVLARMLNPEEVLQELARANKTLLILGALAHYATYPLRGSRWRRALAHMPSTAGSGKFALIVFFYNAVDNIVPAKIGDLYASHLVRINCGIRRSAALGSLVFLRTLDAWTVLGLGSAASWLLFAVAMEWAVIWSLIAGALIALGTTSVILVLLLLKRRVPRWLPEQVQEMVQAFNVGMWPRTREIPPIFFLTFCVWALEVSWMVLLLSAFNVPVSPAVALFVTMLPMLASAFPVTPSGAGVVEVTLYTCLRLVSVASPVAMSLTVVNRLIDYWFHIILGLFTWSVRRFIGLRTWREARTSIVPVSIATSRKEAISER
jgi:uncharacterized protein (TIRG00374 family)